MTNFDEYMTNTNLALQAIIRYDDGREIRVFNVKDKRCCVFIQNDNEHFWLLRKRILDTSHVTQHHASDVSSWYL